MRVLIIIPTYNERENIAALIRNIWNELPSIDILVVDDNSPDGTGEVVEHLIQANNNQNLALLNRPHKEGLGKAYLAGFQWAIQKQFDAMIEMDADFSHRPEDLKHMLACLNTFDFVIGSRYVLGGSVRNWSLWRRMISRGGSLYASLILGYPVKDWTGGFNLWKREVIQALLKTNISSEGYSFQIELKYKALKLGFRGIEFPILFDDRRVGQSKMSSRIVWEALLQVWRLRAWKPS
ncbi:MAG: polyprenol monophosphomannose synthase [Bdellovibrionaceae bacterium]|nr:polyprenol monophosphomannose synthase [Pseudobdellovibrionaceae bacterium]MDW8189792.1 polyprenol monophosphomannose synthase [Pseudobdellovibrionaceae bacterium]